MAALVSIFDSRAQPRVLSRCRMIARVRDTSVGRLETIFSRIFQPPCEIVLHTQRLKPLRRFAHRSLRRQANASFDEGSRRVHARQPEMLPPMVAAAAEGVQGPYDSCSAIDKGRVSADNAYPDPIPLASCIDDIRSSTELHELLFARSST